MLVLALVLTFYFLASNAENLKISLDVYGSHCVPTSVERGPCHTCVCSASGVYFCRSYGCNNEGDNNTRALSRENQECGPHYIYNHQSIYCRCDENGSWRSDNCRSLFHFVVHKEVKTLKATDNDIHCKPHSLYLVDCNVCACTKHGNINHTLCTQRNCVTRSKAGSCKYGQFVRTEDEFCGCESDINYYIDRLCIKLPKKKDHLQMINKLRLENIIGDAKSVKNFQDHIKPCVEGVTYNLDCNECLCNNTKWKCSNKDCSLNSTVKNDSLKFLKPVARRSKLSHLPEIHDGEICEEGKIYRMDCNTCQCLKNNHLMCTKMACFQKMTYKDKMKSKSLRIEPLSLDSLPNVPAEKCQPGQIYKKGCEFCYCNHLYTVSCSKSYCSDAPKTHRLDIEKTEIIGKFLKMNEAGDLPQLPTSSPNCKPGMMYRVKCNTCLCLADGILSCQQNICTSVRKNTIEASNSTASEHESKSKISELPEIRDSESCVEGKSYKLDCNTCHCLKNNQLLCTQNSCTQKVETPNKAKKMAASSNIFPDLPAGNCEPGKLYKKGCQICYCDNFKKGICSKKSCNSRDVRTSSQISREGVLLLLNEKEFETLPRLFTTSANCESGKTYRIDCNTCLCLDNGNLMCEKNMCLSVDDTNRILATKVTGTPCNTTYDTTCVFCECKNEKYQCDYVRDCFLKKTGRQLHEDHKKLKPRLTLNLLEDTCLPGMVYRVDCNNCYCQSDHTLRCTKKGCLNNVQVRKLKIQKERLENLGL